MDEKYETAIAFVDQCEGLFVIQYSIPHYAIYNLEVFHPIYLPFYNIFRKENYIEI